MHDLEAVFSADFFDGFYAIGDVVMDIAFFAVEGQAVMGIDED